MTYSMLPDIGKSKHFRQESEMSKDDKKAASKKGNKICVHFVLVQSDQR